MDQFLTGAPLVFQSGKSDGLNATYHFRFTGAEQQDVTFRIQDKKLQVQGGHVGKCDLQVTADTDTWIGFVRKEKSIVWALLTRKVRLKGSPKLLLAFGKCFP